MPIWSHSQDADSILLRAGAEILTVHGAITVPIFGHVYISTAEDATRSVF